MTGFPAENEAHCKGRPEVAGRPLSVSWISDDLIADTRKVWSKVYGRVLAREEAVEILMNVRRLAEVALDVRRKGRAE